MTDILAVLHVTFYDDPENRTTDTYRGRAESKTVEFLLPPRPGDYLYPSGFGIPSADQPIVTHIEHGPRINREGGSPEAIVTVAMRYDQKLVDHLDKQDGWNVNLPLRF